MIAIRELLASHRLQSVLLALVVLAVWQGACRLFDISPLVLPSPDEIAGRLYTLVASGTIWPHLWATLVEILSGFVFGVLAGLVIGAMISLIPVVERLVYPYLVAVLIVLSAIGLVMHGVTRVAARRYIFWIRRNEAPVLV